MKELVSHAKLCQRLDAIAEEKAKQLVSCPLEEVEEIRNLIKGLNVAKSVVEAVAEEE